MPLLRRKKQPTVLSSEEIKEHASFFLSGVSLRRDGRMDIATTGPVAVDEHEVLTVMGDVFREWLGTAAHAWRGYELFGRGFLLLQNHLHEVNYFVVDPGQVPVWLPRETVDYCARYDPRTEFVFAIYGFPRARAPETCASLWLRPYEGWVTPAEAWRQSDQATQDAIDRVMG